MAEEQVKNKKDKKESVVDQAVEVAQNAPDYSTAIDLGIATFGWSEIGRIGLRIICNVVPLMEEGAKKFGPKARFYFSGISLKKMVDIAQLLEFLILVGIWSAIIFFVVLICSIYFYCQSSISNAVGCYSDLITGVIKAL
jgi:hypothetical protein